MKKNTKNKITGIAVILAGIALLALGGWLFTKVWGTALLYTDAALGKAAKYYWVVLIGAVMVLITGIMILRKKAPEEAADTPAPEAARTQETGKAKGKVSEQADKVKGKVPEQGVKAKEVPHKVSEGQAAEKNKETKAPGETGKPDKTEESGCPNCGAAVNPGAKFCIKCGHKLI